MLKRVNTFFLIVHFWTTNGSLVNVTIGLFDTTNTFGITMVLQMNEMLATYELNTKVLAYIKAKGKILLVMNNALTFVVSCEVLGLTAPFIKN